MNSPAYADRVANRADLTTPDRTSDACRRLVEQGGFLALATGVAAIIGTFLLFGDIPMIVTSFLAPATWALCAMVPWHHAGDPLRVREFGFLAVATALALLFGGPVLLLMGPTNILALTALILGVRLLSPYLVIAAMTMVAVSWFSAKAFVMFTGPIISPGPYICLLVALVGMWWLLRRRQTRSPWAMVTSEDEASGTNN